MKELGSRRGCGTELQSRLGTMSLTPRLTLNQKKAPKHPNKDLWGKRLLTKNRKVSASKVRTTAIHKE